MLFWNVTVNDCVPMNSSPVLKSTVGSPLLARWKLWMAEWSSTTIVYVPGRMRETFLPLASFSVMLKRVIHADDSPQRRIVAERGAGESGDRKGGEGESKPHLTTVVEHRRVDRLLVLPVVEAVLSLHVLTEPKHHPLQHPWVRRARDFPAALKREIAAFGFAYRGFIPEFLVPSPDTVCATFEDELGNLERLEDPTRRPRSSVRCRDHRGERDEGLLEDPGVREHASSRAAYYGADASSWPISSSRSPASCSAASSVY